MSQRERQASGGVLETEKRPSAGQVEGSNSGSAPAARDGAGPTPPPLWEDLYRSASPAQQFELLSLASRQGVLYAHQLPVSSNGTAGDRSRQTLTQLLSGQLDELEPVRVTPPRLEDRSLDVCQAEAVARALATPDICLIQGLPGTGKSRLVAEIVTQAARRGERVLLLAPAAPAIDRVLEQVGSRDAVCAVRCLAPGERPEDLPAFLQGLTFQGQIRRLREQPLARARQGIATVEKGLARLGRDEATWPRLENFAQHLGQLEEQIEELRRRGQQIAAEVEREAASALDESPAPGSFAATIAARRRVHQEKQARLEAALAEANGQVELRRQELQALDSQVAALEPMAEAKQRRRWWTGRWWRATFFCRNVVGRVAELRQQRQQLAVAVEGLEQQQQHRTAEREQTRKAWDRERAALVSREIGQRQQDLDDQEAVLSRERQLLQEKWQATVREMDERTPRPVALTGEAVQAARAGWQQQLKHQEEELAFARQWAAFLEEAVAPTSADALSARFPGYVNLLAATPAALAADPQFGELGEASGPGGNFDLLVFEEAEQLTETEFLRAARRARRWVLVGEPTRLPKSPKTSEVSDGSSRSSFFQRLWQHLYVSGVWVETDGRLCCRLAPLAPEHQKWIESEHVADLPDVQLRILAPPHGRPALAEVVFPPAMALAQAKAFLFKELEELPVGPLICNPCWADEADRPVFRLTDAVPAKTVSVELEPGVREVVGAHPESGIGRLLGDGGRIVWQTCWVEFDRGAGWDRARAEEWVQKHLRVCDLGRAVRLPTPHRMHPRLADHLAELLAEGGYHQGSEARDQGLGVDAFAIPDAGFEFVTVPSAAELGGAAPRRKGAPEPRGAGNHRGGRSGESRRAPRTVRRSGAGLELDLANARQREQLPAEVRAVLPDRGLVNLPEAQAVVRSLEALLADRTLRTAAERWQAQGSTRPPVGVIALYAAQARLIAHLVQKNARIVQSGISVEIGIPAAFRQREGLVILVSLTRSHSHRAVSFGESPELLALALTRARARLLVFGDAGTLARRVEWSRALDHLDEAAAARERELVARLAGHREGQERRASHRREGGSA